jgi:hypothetical protein
MRSSVLSFWFFVFIHHLTSLVFWLVLTKKTSFSLLLNCRVENSVHRLHAKASIIVNECFFILISELASLLSQTSLTGLDGKSVILMEGEESLNGTALHPLLISAPFGNHHVSLGIIMI